MPRPVWFLLLELSYRPERRMITMRGLLFVTLGVILSGVTSLAGSLALCGPMPCCVNQPAAIVPQPVDCCGITAPREEQPQKLEANRYEPPKQRVDSLPSVVRLAIRIDTVAPVEDPSPPPTTHRRLAALSVLLI